MKTTLTTACIILAVFCVILWMANDENKKAHQRDRKILLEQIAFWRNYGDSCLRVADAYRDSSEVFLAFVVQANLKATLAEQKVKELTTRYKKIEFMRTESDEERDSILRNLYPSLSK